MNVPIYRVVRIVVACGALAVLTAGCRQQVADSTTSNSDNVARRSAVGNESDNVARRSVVGNDSDNVARRSAVGNAFQQDSDSAASVSGKVAQLPADGSDSSVTPVSHNRRAQYPRLLSEYALFDGAISALQPTEGVVQYDVNTPPRLPTTLSVNAVRLPPERRPSTLTLRFDFPVGTIIAKTFYYLHDMTQPDAGRHLIETRILWRQESGWIGIPYLWNEDQSDARLGACCGVVARQWVFKNGEPCSNTHIVPNLNDCKAAAIKTKRWSRSVLRALYQSRF
ncbi:MAG: hypothetical protein R3C56_13095 [Pirellulaceae bacterium]